MRAPLISREREQAALKALVLAFPGATYAAMSKATGIPASTIEHLFTGKAALPTIQRVEAWIRDNAASGVPR